MIIVDIKLHSATTGKVTTLGKLHIVNDDTGDEFVGNYNVFKYGKNGRQMLAHGRVERWRKKSRTIFELVTKALGSLL